MHIAQLYRTIFGDWNTLGREEKSAFFRLMRPIRQVPGVQAALHALDVPEIYPLLYLNSLASKETPPTSSGDDVSESFARRNALYHYFDTSVLRKYATQYQILSHFLTLYGAISMRLRQDSDYLRYASHNRNQARCMSYSILVFFGQDSFDQTWQAFLNYCDLCNQPFDATFMDAAFLPTLYEDTDNGRLDLPAWRRLICEMHRTETMTLMAIAYDIETLLHRAPESADEALMAALSRQFQHHDRNAKLAEFCRRHHISEKQFDAIISEDNTVAVDACKAVMQRLYPSNSLIGFIAIMPRVGFHHMSLLEVFEMLTTSDQRQRLLSILSDGLQLAAKDWEELDALFRLLPQEAEQKALVSAIGADYVRALVQQSQPGLVVFREIIHRNYIKTFLLEVIGMRYFEEHAWKSHTYVQLQQILLPRDEQIAFLQKTFGRESLQKIFDASLQSGGHLYCLKKSERKAYLCDIIGKHGIVTHIQKRGWGFLDALPVDDRLSFLQEGIERADLRALIPIFGDGRHAEQQVMQRLPVDAQDELFTLLLSDANTLAKEALMDVKLVICGHNFSVGFWGMGYAGQTIVLDDGREKLVPGTVAKQWAHIKAAEQRAVSYLDAWEAVRSLGVKAAKNPGGYTRGGDTRYYYGRFLHAPHLDRQHSKGAQSAASSIHYPASGPSG